MDSKKWIVRYIELALDVIVMFVAYAVANKIKFGGFRTGICLLYTSDAADE